MTTTLERLNHPRVTIEENGARRAIRYDMKGWGADIVGEYWPEPRPTDLDPRQSWDGWRYRLPAINGPQFGPYSAPSEKAAQIAILNHLVDSGLMAPDENNGHLDARNAEIAAEILAAWNAHDGKPRVGDFVRMPNGMLRRCAHAWDDGMQTSDGGSFSITKTGQASMSGSLYPSQLWEYFHDTGETKKGRFWFFSHGIAGAGRGVDFFLPCRVYELRPFAMTESEARAHPVAVASGRFWGENHRDHLRAIATLMNPPALSGGYC